MSSLCTPFATPALTPSASPSVSPTVHFAPTPQTPEDPNYYPEELAFTPEPPHHRKLPITTPTPVYDLSYTYDYPKLEYHTPAPVADPLGLGLGGLDTVEYKPVLSFTPASDEYSYWPYPMGHTPSDMLQSMTHMYDQLEDELQYYLPEKMTAAQAYNMINVPRCLQLLDSMLEPCAAVHGSAALKVWLKWVQSLMVATKRSSFVLPTALPAEDKELFRTYSQHWRRRRGGAVSQQRAEAWDADWDSCDLGKPEAQIVLICLAELADY